MTISHGHLKMAFTSVRKNKWRSFLTMLGIIIGIVAVVTIVGVGNGMKQQVTGQINHFGKDMIMVRPGQVSKTNTKEALTNSDILFGRISLSGLSAQDYQTIKQSKGVDQVTPLGLISGQVKSSDNVTATNDMIIATTPALPTALNQSVHYGSFFDDDSELSSAVIGQQVAYDLFGQRAPLGKTFTLRGQSFTVRGVMSEFNAPPLSPTANFDDAIFISYKAANQITASTTQYYAILAKSSEGTSVQTAINTVTDNLKKSHGGEQDFSVLDEQRSVAAASDVIDLFTSFVTAVAAISLFVGGIGIMNIMLVSVTERMHEIGVRKAVGATSHQIMLQFMLESTVLSTLAGILGVLLSILTSFLLHTYTTYKPVMSWGAVGAATLVSMAIGIIFGTLPAAKAARKNPIEALRHE
ncbi:MAG TPA: ABC transporter permease [Candidatus Saccharimonadales bacterium]|nr:ABC transporter permease [Candidatus Saccharimonadales bacterium]